MGRYLDTLQKTLENSVPRPVTVAWPQESTKIAQKANAAFSGEVTPTEAMQTLQQQLALIERVSARDDESSTNGGTESGGQ
jgi:ABC-type glycerol-3-phosphate transport system substrate-binding protein